MKKERRRLEKLYGSMYCRMEGVDLGVCWYCGDPRECLDHVPPIGLIESFDIGVFRREGGKLLLVPCCDQCNGVLLHRDLPTPEERVAYLWDAYIKLVDKRSNLWTPEEIRELGPGLRPMVQARAAKTKDLIRKLRGVERRMLECK